MSVNQTNQDEIEMACVSLIYDAGHFDSISAGSILRAFSVCGWNWNWIFFEGLQDEKLSSFGILQSPWGRLKKLSSSPLSQPQTCCFFKSFGSALLWQSLLTRKNGQEGAPAAHLQNLRKPVLAHTLWVIGCFNSAVGAHCSQVEGCVRFSGAFNEESKQYLGSSHWANAPYEASLTRYSLK